MTSIIQDSIGLDSLRNNLRAVRRTWRAWRGQDLLQRPQMRCQTLTLGSDGSAWSICRNSLSAQSVVYSVGVGGDFLRPGIDPPVWSDRACV